MENFEDSYGCWRCKGMLVIDPSSFSGLISILKSSAGIAHYEGISDLEDDINRYVALLETIPVD